MALRGAWGNTIGKLKDAKGWITGPAEGQLLELAKSTQNEIRLAWLRGSYAPLKPSTVARKRREGAPYPEKPWVETGAVLRDSFAPPLVQKARFGGSSRVIIGFSENIHPAAGIPYIDVVRLVEYGSSGQAARPAVEPTLERLRAEGLNLDGMRRAMLDRIRLELNL